MAANPFARLGRQLAFKQENRNFLLFCLAALFFFAGAGLLPLFHQTAKMEAATGTAREQVRTLERMLRVSSHLQQKAALYDQHAAFAASTSAPADGDGDPVALIKTMAARQRVTIREMTSNLPTSATAAEAMEFSLLIQGGLSALQEMAHELATLPGLLAIEQMALRREETGFALSLRLSMATGDRETGARP